VSCPRCGSESEDPAGRCADCGATVDDETLVCVCRTGDVGLLPLLKSLLDAAEIPYVVQGEAGLGLFPLGRFAVGLTNPRTMGASILVPRGRAEEARLLLEAEDAEQAPD